MARRFSSFFSGAVLPSLAVAFALASLPFAPTGCARAAACQRNSDCDNAYCFEGECKRDCIDETRDCPANHACNVNAQCVPIYEGGGPGIDAGSGGTAGMDAGADVSVDAEPDVIEDAGDIEDANDDASIDDGGNGGFGGSGGRGGSGGVDDGGAAGAAGGGIEPGSLGLLDLCSDDKECQSSLLCRPMYVGGPHRCTKACTASAQCMMGTRCEPIDGERYCAQSDIGRWCANDNDCNSRCMTLRQYCTSECSSGADCPNGFGCTGVGDPAVRMCVKLAVYCGDSPSVCAGGAGACDKGMLVSGCSIRCNNDSDCPQRASGMPPWRCSTYDGFCDRPGDVAGPLAGGEHAEYLCANVGGSLRVVNACSDGLNIDFDKWVVPNPPAVNCQSGRTKPGVAGDSCVDSCRYQGACPFGFGCAATTKLNSSASRSGLCIPSGFGEVGDFCTKHTDCAFSLCDSSANKCSRDCSADGVCPSGSSCVATGDFVEGIPFKRCE